MRPEAGRFLATAAVHLMTKTAEAIGPGYEQSSISVMGLMLNCVAEELERAAARRVAENRELRRIFAGAADVVADPELRAKLVRAAGGDDADLAVSALEATNCELRALLIDLHAHVEEQDSPESREIEEIIWRELVASTERRKLAMGPF